MQSDRDKMKTRPDWYVEAKRSLVRFEGARAKWKTDQTETGTVMMGRSHVLELIDRYHGCIPVGFDLQMVRRDLGSRVPGATDRVKVPAALVVALSNEQEIYEEALRQKKPRSKTAMGQALRQRRMAKVQADSPIRSTPLCASCDDTGEVPHPATGAREGGMVPCLACGPEWSIDQSDTRLTTGEGYCPDCESLVTLRVMGRTSSPRKLAKAFHRLIVPCGRCGMALTVEEVGIKKSRGEGYRVRLTLVPQ